MDASGIGTGLLEGERELAALDALLEGVVGGSGGLVVVRGPAGIGKSALLAAARHRARQRGLGVLAARGEEIEREFAFGVARQLLERPARARLAAGTLTGAAELAVVPLGIAPASRPPSSDEGFASRHGLYWLAADLAAEGPLLLVVDDAQWADSPSLEWLAFLAGRLEEHAIALVLAVRDEGEMEPALTRIELEPAAHRVVPGALSEAAVALMTATALRIDPEREFARAVYRSAGGNPLWTRELLRALVEDESWPRLLASRRVPVTSPLSLTRAVLVRLGQLGSEAVELARAVAVLSSEVDVRDAAAVARLDPHATRRIADVLEHAGILGPGDDRLSFSHPIVRQAVYADLGSAGRAAAHAAAAEALAARGAQPEHVATHLMQASPAGAKSVAERLRRAARLALARGAPQTAVAYLRRAQAERPHTPDGELLHELGVAEATAFDPAALEHLLAAYEAGDARRRPTIAVDAAHVMMLGLKVDEAVALLRRALDDVAREDRENRLRLTAALLPTSVMRGELLLLPEQTPAGRTSGQRALLASMALVRLMRAEPTGPALELARAAWSDGRLLADEGADSPYVLSATAVPMVCDSFDEASAWYGAVLEDAQRRGSVTGFATALTQRAYLRYRQGELGNALGDVRTALEIEAAHATTIFTPGSLAFLIDVLVETGDLDAADAALHAHGWTGPLPELYLFDILLDRRGRLRIAQGKLEEGAADLLAARRRLAWVEHPIANLDSQAGLALAALGRRDEARDLVDGDVERARRVGLPRQIAIALRAAALIDERPDPVRLRQSAELAARAGARLEQARALTDLGATLRRGGHRAVAREPLRHALELATRCGATVLAGRARLELLAAGGRPRRVTLSGRGALTPSELRIAELAAAGQSNREIAQGLFVTVRTVEMHLSAAYRKLNIGSRASLMQALTPPPAETPSVRPPKSFGRPT